MFHEFRKKTVEEDLKQESVCTCCSKKLSAYTFEVLRKKELDHTCQEPIPAIAVPGLIAKPKIKKY